MQYTPHHTPHFLAGQTGVIVELNPVGGFVYSPQAGKAFLSNLLRTHMMRLGSFLRYDVQLHQGKNQWIAKNAVYLGEKLEIVPYLMRNTKLQVRVCGVVCRSDNKTRSAWLWNDDIGRIHVPPCYFRPSMQPDDVVDIIAMYDGEHEDVPWTGVNIQEMSKRESDEKRPLISTMLTTSDGWKIKQLHCHANNTVGYFTFLKNDSTGESAFAAWTDYAKGEHPPTKETLLRVSYFKQARHGKHGVRAVLVTPMGETLTTPRAHSIDSSVHTGSYHSNHMITSPHVLAVNNGRTTFGSIGSCDSRDSMSTSSAQSEMDMAYQSGYSTTPLFSPCPSFEFKPMFPGSDFETWYPIEEENNNHFTH